MARMQAIRAAAWSAVWVVLGGYTAQAEPLALRTAARGGEARGRETPGAGGPSVPKDEKAVPLANVARGAGGGVKGAPVRTNGAGGGVKGAPVRTNGAKDEPVVPAAQLDGQPPRAEVQPISRRRSGTHPAAETIAGVPSGAVHSRVVGGGGLPSSPPQRVARVIPKQACLREPIALERGFGGPTQTLVLTQCNGGPAPQSIEQLSILARPMNAPPPAALATPAAVPHPRDPKKEWLPGVKLLDEGLLARLQSVVDHFRAQRLIVVSGYRPASEGSFHQSAHALDFTIEGVGNEALVAFCRTLPDTGCGYYPNSSFVHLDVRPAGTGHPYWIDASGPGEGARYVSSWPPPRTDRGRDSRPPRASSPPIPCDDQDHWDLFGLGPASKRAVQSDTRSSVDAPARGRSEEDPFRP